MKRLRAMAAVLALAGCSVMNIEDFSGSTPEFRPEEYFLGTTRAWGFFQDRFGRIRREFVVNIEGMLDGDILVLDEHFEYRDGETDRRVWRIKQTGDGHYEGHADDIVGTAKGVVNGRAMRWRYEFDLPIGNNAWRVTFDDWMFLQDERVMLNRSSIYKFGIKLGDVVIFFDKESTTIGDAAAEKLQTAAE